MEGHTWGWKAQSKDQPPGPGVSVGSCFGEKVCWGDSGEDSKPRMEAVLRHTEGGQGGKRPGPE